MASLISPPRALPIENDIELPGHHCCQFHSLMDSSVTVESFWIAASTFAFVAAILRLLMAPRSIMTPRFFSSARNRSGVHETKSTSRMVFADGPERITMTFNFQERSEAGR